MTHYLRIGRGIGGDDVLRVGIGAPPTRRSFAIEKATFDRFLADGVAKFEESPIDSNEVRTVNQARSESAKRARAKRWTEPDRYMRR